MEIPVEHGEIRKKSYSKPERHCPGSTQPSQRGGPKIEGRHVNISRGEREKQKRAARLVPPGEGKSRGY